MGHAFALEGLSDFLGTMDSPHMSYGIDTDILFSIVATAHHSETPIVWNRSKKQKYMADFQYIFLAWLAYPDFLSLTNLTPHI